LFKGILPASCISWKQVFLCLAWKQRVARNEEKLIILGCSLSSAVNIERIGLANLLEDNQIFLDELNQFMESQNSLQNDNASLRSQLKIVRKKKENQEKGIESSLDEFDFDKDAKLLSSKNSFSFRNLSYSKQMEKFRKQSSELKKIHKSLAELSMSADQVSLAVENQIQCQQRTQQLLSESTNQLASEGDRIYKKIQSINASMGYLTIEDSLSQQELESSIEGMIKEMEKKPANYQASEIDDQLDDIVESMNQFDSSEGQQSNGSDQVDWAVNQLADNLENLALILESATQHILSRAMPSKDNSKENIN